MLAILPAAAFGLLAWWHRRARRGAGGDLRDALLFAALAWSLFAVLASEIEGAVSLLRPAPAAIAWGAFTLAVGAAFRAAPRPPPQAGPARTAPPPVLLLILAAALLALVAATALFAAPNTWDSLTYHLPRVAHWIQNASLAPYPTAILRQLDLPPFAELAIAQLALASGGDRLANLVQCAALALAALAASVVARDLGASRAGQALAGIAALTPPMAVLQGSGTQNDLVAGLWVVLVAHVALVARARPRSRAVTAGAAGSLGLALLTKPTAAIFAAPFAVWLAVAWLRRLPLPAAAARILLVAAGAALVNAGHFARNASVFGSPVPESHGAVNETFGLGALASTVLRDAAVQLATPSRAWNRAVERTVTASHRALDLDVNDPRTTWSRARFGVPPVRGGAAADREETLAALFHEGYASNPLHALAIAAAGGVALFRTHRENRAPAVYAAACAAGLLLFAAALKWQPWHARLELPLLLAGAPLVGAAFPEGSRPRAPERLALLLLLLAFPWAVANATRPLLGPGTVLRAPRIGQFFANRPDLEAPYRRAAAAVRASGCRDVGLAIGPDDGEYLLWVLLREPRPASPRIEHVAVGNASARLAAAGRFAGFRPCAVVETRPEAAFGGRVLFSERWSGGRIAVRAAEPPLR